MERRLSSRKTYFSPYRRERSFVGGVPSDPYLISIGNNVIIAVSVEFVTHDIFYHALNQTYSELGNSIRTLIQLLLRIMYVLVVSRKLCPV